jgi:hypothetical protein
MQALMTHLIALTAAINRITAGGGSPRNRMNLWDPLQDVLPFSAGWLGVLDGDGRRFLPAASDYSSCSPIRPAVPVNPTAGCGVSHPLPGSPAHPLLATGGPLLAIASDHLRSYPSPTSFLHPNPQRTVAAHLEHIRSKLGAPTRTAAAVQALNNALYVPPPLAGADD